VKGKRIKVLFVDWGNRESVEEGVLWELPESLKLIERQAVRAKLALTKATKNEEYLQRIRGELMDGEEYQFRKEGAEYVACYRNK
jgi:hypothetical protein